MSVFELRPHHGLCIRFFERKGYSAEFIRHMTEMIAYLNDHNPEVKLVLHTDRICSACPHNANQICESESKVFTYDKRVLALCDLQENQILEWNAFQELLFQKILKYKKLAFVCWNCQWMYICSEKCLDIF